MALPLLLLGITGATVVGVGIAENVYSLSNENLKPTIMGIDARGMGVGAGVVMLLLGGMVPVIGAIGMGLVSASIVNADMTKRVKTGLEPIIKELAQKVLQEQGQLPAPPPQLPGPEATPPVADPDGGGLWDSLINVFTQPAAA